MMMMMKSLCVSTVCVLLGVLGSCQVEAFTTIGSVEKNGFQRLQSINKSSLSKEASSSSSRLFGVVAPGGGGDKKDENQDFPSEEELDSYKGDIDWDAEWKKVVRNQDKKVERPGKDFYKNEAQIAAIRAANKATDKINQSAEKLPSVSLPSWGSLQGDWKVSEK